jgi:hypothetical protein
MQTSVIGRALARVRSEVGSNPADGAAARLGPGRIESISGDLFNCQGAIGLERTTSFSEIGPLHAQAARVEPRHGRVWRPFGHRASSLCRFFLYRAGPETERAASLRRRLSNGHRPVKVLFTYSRAPPWRKQGGIALARRRRVARRATSTRQPALRSTGTSGKLIRRSSTWTQSIEKVFRQVNKDCGTFNDDATEALRGTNACVCEVMRPAARNIS